MEKFPPQQKRMQSDEHKQQVKVITMQALNRLEELKLQDAPSAPPLTSSSTGKKKTAANLLSELDSLPPPPINSPKGGVKASKSSTLPRGM